MALCSRVIKDQKFHSSQDSLNCGTLAYDAVNKWARNLMRAHNLINFMTSITSYKRFMDVEIIPCVRRVP